ncbi:hypothetical protein GCM10020358_01530 [Amorphoplanes nipponensis]|uniref:Uncharacterized protein n=1 Tax=Actinoplanes nipponensis TaxID=135950 RepID=A0A919JFS4_9ACTN|nr:hypothetical protein Ani05nite_17560 [Actinoplanes nipponensis]
MSGADLSDALSDMWRSVLLFVPTALAFLAILLIGYVLARLVRTVVAKTLRRIGFDRAVERGAIGRALGGRAEPSDLCAKIAFYAVLLFALQLAFGIWGPNAVSDLLTALIGWLPRAFVAIVIIVVAAAIGGAARDLIGSALGGLAYGRVLARATYWLIVALGVIAALDQVQIATAVTQPVLVAVLATVAGVLIVGVGGGLIQPMQRRWEVWLDRAGTESAAIREHARSYADERARLAAEQKAAEEEAARAAAERKAAEEQAARAAAELAAEQARAAEQAQRDRTARAAAAAEAARAEAERAAQEAERQRALEAAAAEKTQVIPTQRPWPGSDDRPHVVPGFDDRGADTAETTAWLRREGAAATPADDDSVGVERPGGRRGDDSGGAEPSGDRTGDDVAAGGEVGVGAVAASGPESDDAAAGSPDGEATLAVRSGDIPDDQGTGDTTAGAEPADDAGSRRRTGAVSATALPDDDASTGTGKEADAEARTGADAATPPVRSADDDPERTADVTAPETGPAPPDPDSTVTITPSDRRPSLPQQGGAAEGEKTQVIRVRRDDGPAS